MRPYWLLALFVACAGCAGCATSEYVIRESNYLTYEHAFTDAASEGARKNAEKYCGETKLLAIRTRSACSLARCTTHYQCMDREEAARAAPADARK